MNVLMVAFFFPPDASSGSFRPMYFARDLHAAGHRVTVLTVREEDFFDYQARDAQLISTVGEGVTIVRAPMHDLHRSLVSLRNQLFGRPAAGITSGTVEVAAGGPVGVSEGKRGAPLAYVKDLITDLLTIPDQYRGWIREAVSAGRRVIASEGIDVVYATGSPWSSLLVGTKLKQLTGAPFVCDFRDPWVGQPNYFARRAFCRWQDRRLERRIVAIADRIVANTPELRDDFLRRYPFLPNGRVCAITNGFEGYLAPVVGEQSEMTIVHAGTLNLRNPKALLKAAICLIEAGSVSPEKLRLVMLGGIEVADPELPGLLASPALRGVVQLLPRMPYRDAVAVQQRADALLLLQPADFPLQIPRKLYEYLAFRKPILAIATRGSATANMINNHRLGMVVDDDPGAIMLALRGLYKRWEAGTLDASAGAADQFLNRVVSARLEEVLNSAAIA